MSLLSAVSPVAEQRPLDYLPLLVGGLALVGVLVALARFRKVHGWWKRTLSVVLSVLRWVGMGLAALLLVAGGLSAYGSKANRWRSVPILSGSMSPGLDKGDVAIVRPSTDKDTKVGDVIVFNAPKSVGVVREGEPVIHRIIEIVPADELKDVDPNGVYVRTQGDNNSSADNWIVKLDENIVWQQTDTVRDIGEMFLLIARPRARFGLLAGAAILLMGTAVAEWIGTKPPKVVEDEPLFTDGTDGPDPEPDDVPDVPDGDGPACLEDPVETPPMVKV